MSQRNLRQRWRDWRELIVFLVVMFVFRSTVADWNQVPTGSMTPTILEGDRIVVNKLAYDLKVPFTTVHLTTWADPRRGDIVTFQSPIEDRLLVKRILGVPGDTVAMAANRLFINGERLGYEAALEPDDLARAGHDLWLEDVDGERHYVMLQRGSMPGYARFNQVTVPDGHYLMLGDNRDHSGDFRVFSFVPRQSILGRAHTIAFSVDYERYYAPRWDRFGKSLETVE